MLCHDADEAVTLEKDPKNEFDPHAIRVRRLSGEDLGYVPKDLTVRFPHDVTFGHVHYVGQVPESGVWGALVIASLPFDLTANHEHSRFCEQGSLLH